MSNPNPINRAGCGNPENKPKPPFPPPPPPPGNPPGVPVDPEPEPTVGRSCIYEFRSMYDCDYHGFPLKNTYPRAPGVWKPMHAIKYHCCVNNSLFASGAPPSAIAKYDAIPLGGWIGCGQHSYCSSGTGKCFPGPRSLREDNIHKGKELAYSFFKKIEYQIPVSEVPTWTCPDPIPLKDYPYYADGDTAPRIPPLPIDPPCPDCYKLIGCTLNIQGCAGQPGLNRQSFTGGRNPETVPPTPRYECLKRGSWNYLNAFPAGFTIRECLSSWTPTRYAFAKYDGGFCWSGESGRCGAWRCLHPETIEWKDIPAEDQDDIMTSPLLTTPGGGKGITAHPGCQDCAYDTLIAFQKCGLTGGFLDVDSCPMNDFLDAVKKGDVIVRRLRVSNTEHLGFIKALKTYSQKAVGFYSPYSNAQYSGGTCWIAQLVEPAGAGGQGTVAHHQAAWWSNGKWVGQPLFISGSLFTRMKVGTIPGGKARFGDMARPAPNTITGTCCDCHRTLKKIGCCGLQTLPPKVGILDCDETGACCKPPIPPMGMPRCSNNVKSKNCNGALEKWFENKMCFAVGQCKPLYGSCCSLTTGSCFNVAHQAECAQMAGPTLWRFQNYCGAGGACPQPHGCCCKMKGSGVNAQLAPGEKPYYGAGNMTSADCASFVGGSWHQNQPCKGLAKTDQSLFKPNVDCEAAFQRPCRGSNLPAQNDHVWKMTFVAVDGTAITLWTDQDLTRGNCDGPQPIGFKIRRPRLDWANDFIPEKNATTVNTGYGRCSAYSGLFGRHKNISGATDGYEGRWFCVPKFTGFIPTYYKARFNQAEKVRYRSLISPFCEIQYKFNPSEKKVRRGGCGYEGCSCGTGPQIKRFCNGDNCPDVGPGGCLGTKIAFSINPCDINQSSGGDP